MARAGDTFTEATTIDLTAHTPTGDFPGTSWTVYGVGGIIVDVTGTNVASDDNASNGNRYRLDDNLGSASMVVTGVLTTNQGTNTFVGISAQLSTVVGDPSTEFYWDQATASWVLSDGVTQNTLAEAWPGNPTSMRLVVDGSSIKGLANGAEKVSITSTRNAGTRAGLILGNFSGTTRDGTADNFMASTAAGYTPGAAGVNVRHAF